MMRPLILPALALALAAALSPAPAAAEPDLQLQRQIAAGLRENRIYGVDTSKLTIHQAAALYLELSSPTDADGSDFRTRYELLAILRRNPETNPDLK